MTLVGTLMLFAVCFLISFTEPMAPRWISRDEDALAQAEIETMFQDSRGLMWFAMGIGLVRFDGTQTRMYRHQPGDPNSMTSGVIRVLFEDSKGQFWVGSNGGLNRLNRVSGEVESFVHQAGQSDSLRSNNVWSLCESADGRFWIGTDLGLQLMKDTTFADVPDLAVGITALAAADEGRIWVGTKSRGLYLTDGTSTEAVVPLADTSIRAMTRDQSGAIFVGTQFQGVWTKPSASATFVRLTGTEQLEVTALAKDSLETLWIGTSDGLYRKDPSKRPQPVAIELDPDIEESAIQTIWCDDTGLVWVTNERTGVKMLDRRHERFRNFAFAPEGVSAVWQEDAGEVWLGTKQGLVRLDLDSGARDRFLDETKVRAIRPTSNGSLLLGTDSALLLFDRATHLAQPLLEQQRIWDLVLESDDVAWLATESGVIAFSLTRGLLSRLSPDASATKRISHRVVTSICMTGPGHVWAGTYGGGLNHIASNGSVIAIYRNDPNDPSSLSNDDVADLYIDHSGRLWVITLSGGLNLMHKPGIFERFTSRDGLPDNATVGLIQDNRDQFWAYTAQGIAAFDPITRRYSLYNDDHGVFVGSAIPGAVFCYRQMLWFGGANALVGFDPRTLGNEPKPSIAVTDVMVDNRRRQHLLTAGEKLTMQPQEKSLTIRFGAVDFRPRPNQPNAYLRVGIDSDWVMSNEVNYTQYLPFGGDGVLRLRSADTHQRWVETQVDIHVVTPRWVSWLPLWVAVALTALTTLIYTIVARVNRGKQRKLIEQAELARQRAVLAERQHDVEVQERRMQEEHNQILQEYLEQLSNEIANELHDGPLGRITGLGYQIYHWITQSGEGTLREQLQHVAGEDIPKICDDLRGLCGELLTPDLRNGLRDEMAHYADVLSAQSPGLEINCHWRTETEPLTIDAQATIFRVYRTLIKNVAKHANADKLDVSLTTEDSDVILEISDNGCGFEPPDNWDDFKANRHYGLYLANYFCNSLGGSMQVDSKIDQGTRIMIRVPASHHDTEVGA